MMGRRLVYTFETLFREHVSHALRHGATRPVQGSLYACFASVTPMHCAMVPHDPSKAPCMPAQCHT